LEHQAERGLSHPFGKVTEKFVSYTRGGTGPYLFVLVNEGCRGSFFDGESGSGGMTDHPNHSDGILLKPFLGVPDRANDPISEVVHSAHTINDGEIGNIVEETVDRNVTAKGILRGCSKALRSGGRPVLRLHLLRFGTAAKRGDFDDLGAFEENMNEPKPSADGPAVSEEGLDFVGMSIGGYVEIFRSPPEEQITNTPSHEISQEPMSMEAVEDLQCVFIDHLSGDGMFRPRDDEREVSLRLVFHHLETEPLTVRHRLLLD